MELIGAEGNTLSVADARQESVVLGVPGAGECSANMDFYVSITTNSNDELALATTVVLDGFDHPDCPAVQSKPCEVFLDMRGNRR
jgi:hypothetical protein